MAVYSIMIFNNKNQSSPKTLSKNWYLGKISFFAKKKIKEYITFASRKCIKRTKDKRYTIPYKIQNLNKTLTAHTWVGYKNIGVVIITDNDYDSKVAHKLINMVLDKADFLAKKILKESFYKDRDIVIPEVNELLKSAQIEENIDKVKKIKRQIAEIKEHIVTEIFPKLLARGEKLEDLVKLSEDLSKESKEFFKKAKKAKKVTRKRNQRSCCYRYLCCKIL